MVHFNLESIHKMKCIYGTVKHNYSEQAYVIFVPHDLITCCKLERYHQLRLIWRNYTDRPPHFVLRVFYCITDFKNRTTFQKYMYSQNFEIYSSPWKLMNFQYVHFISLYLLRNISNKLWSWLHIKIMKRICCIFNIVWSNHCVNYQSFPFI